MAMPAENSLFQAPGPARVILKHLHIMIGFQNEHIDATHPLNHELGGMPKIGQNANISVVRAHQKTDGIIRVVRDTERIDDDVAGFESCAGGEEVKIEFELQRQFN